MKQADVNKIISEVLGVRESAVKMSTSAENMADWDSLAHIDILTKLDRATAGKAASLKPLAVAFSVDQIIGILRENQLIDD